MYALLLIGAATPIIVIVYVMTDTLRQPDPISQIWMLEDIGLYAQADELRKKYHD